MSKEASRLSQCSIKGDQEGFVQLHAESTARLKAALDCHHLDVIDLFRALAEWEGATVALASRIDAVRTARHNDASRRGNGGS